MFSFKGFKPPGTNESNYLPAEENIPFVSLLFLSERPVTGGSQVKRVELSMEDPGKLSCNQNQSNLSYKKRRPFNTSYHNVRR